ncbi:MAG: hypothetical protein AAF587_30950 [Bacteroidota bacterium]
MKMKNKNGICNDELNSMLSAFSFTAATGLSLVLPVKNPLLGLFFSYISANDK